MKVTYLSALGIACIALYAITVLCDASTDENSDASKSSAAAMSGLNISKLMGVAADDKDLVIHLRPEQPHTSFQTVGGYNPEHDVRTDAVLLFISTKDQYKSWRERGYITQTMYGFRKGIEYVTEHPDEAQTNAKGEMLTCGPGSYYMVPTRKQTELAIEYFRDAIKNGTSAIFPEEPEFFVGAGYSESFKKAWQEYYNEPWQDETSSIEARWKSNQLKSEMEYRMIKAILQDAKAIKPEVIRGVAAHSSVTYYYANVCYPHYRMLMMPELQEMLGQVWTGTARYPCKYEGVVAERSFENGYLEYSSLYNLGRDTGKRIWFVMDPLEDNPDLPMWDYIENYHKTLTSSLMFEGVDEFEVLPWPSRIFGRVPAEYATVIGSVINMLADIRNQKEFDLDSGTQGIATFIADSVAWQRGDPYGSNYDTFYGITLPLIIKGIPIQVAQLERTSEKNYLKPYKVLVVSYDMMKPIDPAYNKALASWVNSGGTLIILGGTDEYNKLHEWWRSLGYTSPQEHLLDQLGVKIQGSASISGETEFKTLASEPNAYRNKENLGVYTLDVSDYVQDDGYVYLKFEDSLQSDGWGVLVRSAQLKINGNTVSSFNAGSEEEKSHLIMDNGSMVHDGFRFADASNSWIYKFKVPKGENAVISLEMGNQYRVSVATSPIHLGRMKAATVNPLTNKWPEITIPGDYVITAYKVDESPMYAIADGDYYPFFEKQVGKGTLIFAGIPPSYFASSKESAEQFRSIIAYACDKAGLPYKEQGYIKVQRGRYFCVRSMDTAVRLKGRFIDVLDPNLRIVRNPQIPAGGVTVMAKVDDRLSQSMPTVLLSSGRIEASVNKPLMTSIFITGPLKTRGITRISTAGKDIVSVIGLDTSGKEKPVDFIQEGASLKLEYDNLPDGLIIKVEWR